MSIAQFLLKLRATNGPWAIDHYGMIRRDYSCPIQAVANHDGWSWDVAASRIGLTNRNALRIMRAADGAKPHSQPLRRQLLKATVERTK